MTMVKNDNLKVKKLQQQSTVAVTDKGTTNTCAAFSYYMYTPDNNVYQVTWQQS